MMTTDPAATTKADLLFVDGTHWYWSTHCRHGNEMPPWDERHLACQATELAPGVPRRPAQCKICAEPCMCLCHRVADE